jgi:hypothetical protein
MSIPNTIDLLTLACLALLAWAVIATVILLDKMEALELEKARRKKAETADQEIDVRKTEIPENDKDWHIRSYVVEGIRAGIINRLGNTSAVLVDTSAIHGDLWITHGEAHALILPFLQKGYFAYKDIMGYSGYKVTRFRIMKHRDPERNALEITEELLIKNAQL